MKKIFLMLLYLFISSNSHATFDVFLSNEMDLEKPTSKFNSYSCDITLRYEDADHMCKVTIPYAKQQNVQTAVYRSLKIPSVVLVKFTLYGKKLEMLIDNFITYDECDTGWVSRTYKIIDNLGKEEFKLLSELQQSDPPLKLVIRLRDVGGAVEQIPEDYLSNGDLMDLAKLN
jgi:hypothetical protein